MSMEAVGVLMMSPMNSYLEEELDKRFKLFRLWNFPQKDDFLKQNSDFIHAIVGNPFFGTDRELIDSLPVLEIVSSFSVGSDHVDLAYCKEKGISVTNTPDVLNEDVADTAIGLILATLRGICTNPTLTGLIFPIPVDLRQPTLIMETIGVLLTTPVYSYLEEELDSRFKLFRIWNFPQKDEFLKENSDFIRAIVGTPNFSVNREVIDSLPALEIISSFSVGLDHVDLAYCKEKGVSVTNTPDVLTEDVADTAIGLILATLRGICECDRYVRAGLWKKGDFKLTTKVRFLHLLLNFFSDLIYV
ncbi:unnamed protein product [Lactuca saligna]|uniref:D-isomer specific 2-hydroxyacid dehydrogenase catalytic domain-containing protein n=1 Tax=Lactuca saligna TaxID=75948 RepID=A0AA36E7R7_LACSI|nr:unnamed protein product [Lactuca saligna]